jgi:hypothetical protein
MAQAKSDPPPVLMQEFFAANARGLMAAQQALDEHGRERILAWEQQGLPPTVWTWANCRLCLPVAFECRPKGSIDDSTQLALSPRLAGQGRVTITLRYLLNPQDETDE